MPILPIRGLGKIGVIADTLPFDTPFNAFHEARNVAFRNGILERTPVYKKVETNTSFTGTPIGMANISFPEDPGHIVVVNSDGKLEELYNASITDVSPTTALTATNQQVVHTSLSQVNYLCIEGNAPVYKNTSMTSFDYIPGWDANDSAKSFRSFGDFLIALNINKNGTEYPTMVKWSDAVQAGAPPSNWDVTSDTSLAGENVLNTNGEILDGKALGNQFILYGTESVYRMQYVGQPFIFRFDPIFNEIKVMGKNCVASTDSVHYVFGQDDIYVHDGMSKESLTETRVRRFIYDRMDKARQNKFFVYHDINRSEIHFNYVAKSDDAAVPYGSVDGCNEAAVFNYRDNTWSFIDVPSVVAGSENEITDATTWADLGNWNETNFSWLSIEGNSISSPIFVSTGALGVPVGIFFRDNLRIGLVQGEVQEEFRFDGFAEVVFKDFDDVGAEAFGRKMIKRVYPYIRAPDTDSTLNVIIGASDSPNQTIRWEPTLTFNPFDDHKLDTRINGRYIAMRIEFPKTTYAQVSGFDMDLVQIARR